MDEYKSNSLRSKEAVVEKKKIEKVITGTVRTKKKSSGRKLADVFISEDVTSVKSYLVSDVLIPALKDTLFEAVTSGLSMLLGGDGRSSSIRRNGSSTNSRDSYSQYYKKGGTNKSNVPNYAKSNYTYDDIILDSRGEAEEVLDAMLDYVETYGMVSLGDLYEAVGQTPNFTDYKYGWTNLNSASIAGNRSSGYWIKFPRVVSLD